MFSKTGFKQILNYMTFNMIKPLRESLNHAETYEVYNIKRTMLEIQAMLALAVVCSVLKPDAPDDDKEDPSLQYLAYVTTMRILYEMNSSFSPVDAYGVISSPITAQNSLDQMIGLGDLVASGKYDDVVTRGKYRGKTYLEKSAIKLSPYKNVYENFEHPDFEAKERYMKPNMGVPYKMIVQDSPYEVRKNELTQRREAARSRREEHRAKMRRSE
jgi:hypothetical protein